MKRLLVASVVAFAAVVCFSDTASAQQPAGYSFFPFGFYQPYGAQYSSTQPTPPYFALNPPVYYGARYARPYGMSPFAAPPMVSSSRGYTGRLRTDFHRPPQQFTSTPGRNPCVSYSKTKTSSAKKVVGEIRENPFVASSQIAKN